MKLVVKFVSIGGRCFGLHRRRKLAKFSNSLFSGVLLGVALYVSNSAVYGVCKFKKQVSGRLGAVAKISYNKGRQNRSAVLHWTAASGSLCCRRYSYL